MLRVEEGQRRAPGGQRAQEVERVPALGDVQEPVALKGLKASALSTPVFPSKLGGAVRAKGFSVQGVARIEKRSLDGAE